MVDPHLVPVLVAHVFGADHDAFLERIGIVAHGGVEPPVRARPRRQARVPRAALVNQHHARSRLLRRHRRVEPREPAADHQHVAVVRGGVGRRRFRDGQLVDGARRSLRDARLVVARAGRTLRRAASERRHHAQTARCQTSRAQERTARHAFRGHPHPLLAHTPLASSQAPLGGVFAAEGYRRVPRGEHASPRQPEHPAKRGARASSETYK